MKVGEGAVECRWLEPTDRAVRSLRRYAAGGGLDHRHDVSVEVGIVACPLPDDYTVEAQPQRRWPGDPPWPAECSCGYAFTDDDMRQVNAMRLYRDQATGREWTLSWRWEDDPRACPPGSMWDARWMPAKYRGADGRCLTVRCPNGMDWPVDMPSSGSGGRWTRTGDPTQPATLTVQPSIAIGDPKSPDFYHGFLQQGRLTAHIG